MRKLYYILSVAFVSLLSSCGDDIDPIERDWGVDNGVESYGIEIKDVSVPMIHQGGLHSADDFTRVKGKVANGEAPWIDGWNRLMQNRHFNTDGNPITTPNPTKKIIRDGNKPEESEPTNWPIAADQVHAAYQYALAWKVSDKVEYAQAASNILQAWATTCERVSGDPNYALAAGLCGYQFAIAGEIMRDYWNGEQLKTYQDWIVKVFYEANHGYLEGHMGSEPLHFWANWDLCNLASMMAVGVMADRRDIYNEAVEYLLDGIGNGCLRKTIIHVFDGENAGLAQIQESGRDQGHATLVIGLLGVIAQVAWNQEDDFFGYNDNVILKASEYTAKYNVAMLDVPFVPYEYKKNWYETQLLEVIGEGSRGAKRPMWELFYYHYTKVKNLNPERVYYTSLGVNQMRPEGGAPDYGGGGGYDLLGCGTLMFPR